MADTTTTLNNQNGVSDLTPEQAKALHAKLNRYYRERRGSKKKANPVVKPRGKVTTFQRSIDIEESATDFQDINNEPFSLTPNSIAQIWVRIGKEKIKCVNTGQTMAISGAAVYRIYL